MHRYRWLEELHAAHYSTLLRLAKNRLYSMTGSIADAEDVVQDVFLLAAEKDIRHYEKPLAWLMKATTNLCMQRMDRVKLDAKKEERFIQSKLDFCSDRSEHAIDQKESETDALLWLLLLEQTLPPDDWELLRKYCLEGIPIGEIADETNEPINRLYVRIHRIRKKLAKISPDM